MVVSDRVIVVAVTVVVGPVVNVSVSHNSIPFVHHWAFIQTEMFI